MKKLFYMLILAGLVCFAFSAGKAQLQPKEQAYSIFNEKGIVLLSHESDRAMQAIKDKSEPLATKIKYVVVQDYDHFADSAYWMNLSQMEQYKDFAKFINFSDLSNGTIKMNDLQMVVLPMGLRPLTATIVTKLKDLIQKKKRILLTGDAILYYAFNPASQFKDPEVQDFLMNTLGIKYPITTPVSKQEGNTLYWWSFNIHGNATDPIGRGIRKFCNEGSRVPPDTTWWPLAGFLALDVFQSADITKYFQVEHFKRADDDPRTDTLVATRMVLNDSARVVFYSIGFEAFAGDIPRSTLLERCITWCTEDIAPDGPQVQVDPLRMDFGYLPVADTMSLPLVVKNVGNQPLIIDEIDFFDDGDACFTLTSGGFRSGTKKVTLKTGDTYLVTVMFKPKDKINYAGILTVKSNSVYYKYYDIDVVGVGGKDVSGPKIDVSGGATMDFDTISTSNKNMDLVIHNKGESDLIIDKLKVIENDDDVFNFPQTINVPFTVGPNDSNHTPIKVRFSLRTDQRMYKGKIQIHSNATNAPDFFIDLVGVIGAPSSVSDGKTSSNDGMFNMSVSPNPVNNNSKLNYSLSGMLVRNLNIDIFDIHGGKILNLYSGVLQPGDYQFDVSNLSLAPNVYVVIAELDGEKISIQFIYAR